MEIKTKNTNMNFYRMDVNPEEHVSKRNRSTLETKLEVFKNVSSRLKSLTKASHIKNPDNNWWLKAGPDPLSKDQNFSEFVDRPWDLWNIQMPKPKLAETPYAPIIEDCVQTLCVPINNRINFTTPSQRVGANYSPLCDILMLNFAKKCIVFSRDSVLNHKLYADTRTQYEKVGGLPLIMSMQSQDEVQYQRFYQSLVRYNNYINKHIDSATISPLRTYWVTKIIDLLPNNMKIKKSQIVARLINTMVQEIKSD